MGSLSQNALYKKFETQGHKHFCANSDCRQVYDCLDVPYLHRCATPQKNGRCQSCRGTAVPVWIAGQQFKECCVNNVRHITNRDELYAHRLAGPGPWFKCKTCARCGGWPLGFNPNKKKENSHG